MEGQVPGGEPGVFPLVAHAHDPHRVEVAPVAIADILARAGRGRVGVVAVEPALDVEDVRLLRPEQAGECLPLDRPLVLGGLGRVDRGVERVGLRLALGDDGVDLLDRVLLRHERQAEPQGHRLAGRDLVDVLDGRLGPLVAGIHAGLAVDDVAVEGVLHILG